MLWPSRTISPNARSLPVGLNVLSASSSVSRRPAAAIGNGTPVG